MRKISKNLKLTKEQTKIVWRVMKRVEWCLSNGREIDVTREKREVRQVNVVDLQSQDAQYVADYLEAGYSFEQTCIHLNTAKRKKTKNVSP